MFYRIAAIECYKKVLIFTSSPCVIEFGGWMWVGIGYDTTWINVTFFLAVKFIFKILCRDTFIVRRFNF